MCKKILLTFKRSHQTFFIWCLLLPAIIIFLVYRVIPLFWNLILSFHFWSPTKDSEFAGFYHYKEMFLYDDVFWQSLKNTLMFMTGEAVAIILALGFALIVNKKIPLRSFYRVIIFIPYPLMIVTVGVIWRWLYDEKGGLINFFLCSVGLIDSPIAFLETNILAMPAVMVAAIWQILGFFMIIILSGLQNIPVELYEAAAVDGAKPFKCFWCITLPLLRPSLFLCCVVGIIASFTSFDLIYVMTGGGPGHSTELLITYIYKVAFKLIQFDYAGALTIIMVLFFAILAAIANLVSGGEAGKVETTY